MLPDDPVIEKFLPRDGVNSNSMDQFINLDPGAMRQSVPALVAGLMFVVLPIWYIYVWLVAKSLYQV